MPGEVVYSGCHGEQMALLELQASLKCFPSIWDGQLAGSIPLHLCSLASHNQTKTGMHD